MSIIDELVTTHKDGEPYGVNDLNRIGNALIYIRDYLNENKYYVDLPAPIRTDWSAEETFPTQNDLKNILRNVEALRKTATVLPNMPQTPEDMDGLTAVEANNIESILFLSYELVRMIIAAFNYAGELYCGEVI